MLYEISNKQIYWELHLFHQSLNISVRFSDNDHHLLVCASWVRWDIVVFGWHGEWHDAYIKSYFYSTQYHECKENCLRIIKCFIGMNAWNQLLYIYFGFQSIKNLFKICFCTCHSNRYNTARYGNYTWYLCDLKESSVSEIISMKYHIHRYILWNINMKYVT